MSNLSHEAIISGSSDVFSIKMTKNQIQDGRRWPFFFSHDLAKMPLFTLKNDLEEQIMAQNDVIGEVFHLM